MSTRARLSAAVSKLTVRQWGAVVRILPVVENQYTGSAADPERAEATIAAIVARQNLKADIQGARRGTQMQGSVQFAARTTRVFIKAADYAALGYTVRQGDRVILVEDGAEQMRVALVETTDVGGTTLELTPAHEPAPDEEAAP